MNNDKDIFLADTTMKYSVLKKKLSDVYELDLITRREKSIYIGLVLILSGIIIYQYIKK